MGWLDDLGQALAVHAHRDNAAEAISATLAGPVPALPKTIWEISSRDEVTAHGEDIEEWVMRFDNIFEALSTIRREVEREEEE